MAKKRKQNGTLEDRGCKLPRPGGTGVADSTQELVTLHRARFVAWDPSSVVALAAAPDGTLLAVGRESGDVELWETHAWSCLVRLPGKEDSSLTSLAWARDTGSGEWRLFSGGLDGQLLEWDLQGRRPKASTDSHGGAVWALASEPACESADAGWGPVRIAAACDDGCARVFAAESGEAGLAYTRAMPAVEGRVLCVAWHPNAHTLLTGTSAGALHAWDVASARHLLCIDTGTGGSAAPCVWAAAVLADGTIVSGDGGGSVQWWDARLGTRLAEEHRHTADVLALAAAPAGDVVVAAGVDPCTALFRRVPNGDPGAGGEAWVYLDAKRAHTHDVRAAAVVTPPGSQATLVTGGNDAMLFAYPLKAFQQAHPVRISACPDPPLIHLALAAQPAQILCVSRGTADVWQLGAVVSRTQQVVGGGAWEEGAPREVTAPPRHLARVQPRHAAPLLWAALAPDGAILALGYSNGAGLYRLPPPARGAGRTGAVQPKRIARKPLDSSAFPEGTVAVAGVIAGAGADARLLLAGPQGHVAVVDIGADAPRVLIVMAEAASNAADRAMLGATRGRGSATAAGQAAPRAARLAASPDGRWAALGGAHAVDVLSLERGAHHAQLPLPEVAAPVTALAFAPEGNVLAVGFASNAVWVYDVAKARPSAWSIAHGAALPPRLLAMPGALCSLSFSPAPQLRALLAATPCAFCLLDLDRPLSGAPSANGNAPKRRRTAARPAGLAADAPGANPRVIPLDRPTLAAAFTGPTAALLVEKLWAQVLAQKAPPLHRHLYGL